MFAPGGLVLCDFRPRVVMSQNLLPFELAERQRYGRSLARVRLELLLRAQRHAFETADGVIFLSSHAQKTVLQQLRHPPRAIAVIPHGVDARFRRPPREQRPISTCTFDRPLRLLYVSSVSPYKHCVAVARAVARLRSEKIPVALELIGASDHSASLRELTEAIAQLDPTGSFIRYHGAVSFETIERAYHDADIFVFASTCENMPNILLEAMAGGLPIACSNRGPMPEVLGAAGTYFDPEQPGTIDLALRRLAEDTVKRRSLAAAAFDRASRYSWTDCASATFRFIASVVRSAPQVPHDGQSEQLQGIERRVR